MCSLIMLRKAEKEEEQRAREKIRLKLEEDKVIFLCFFLSGKSFMYFIFWVWLIYPLAFQIRMENLAILEIRLSWHH